jgi:hypothetical protein
MTRARSVTTTTSRGHRVYRTGAQEVFRAHPKVVRGTSRLAHASSFTMHGHLRTMIVEEILRLAIGSHLCLLNKSRKSSTLSRWYVSPVFIRTSLMSFIGDGGPRALQTSHPFLLMIMHPSFGHGVLANIFEVCSYALEQQQHLRVDRQLNSMFWVPRTCLFILASICSDVKTLLTGDEQGNSSCGHDQK